MIGHTAERNVASELRSIPRSTLIYFCIALVGAIGLTVLEQLTKSDQPAILPPTTSGAPEAKPAGKKIIEPAIGDNPALIAQGHPFAGFDGSWSGSGDVELTNGKSEKINCRASYKVGTNSQTLQQSLLCASESYKFDLRANVISEGNNLTGTWVEASRKLKGNLEGRATRGRILIFVLGASGSEAKLILTNSGDKQSIAIQNADSNVASFSATLTR
jgi:hypothetical protein